MTANERLLRRRLRQLLHAMYRYGDQRMWGDPDEDVNDDGESLSGLRVERAMRDAKDALATTGPK